MRDRQITARSLAYELSIPTTTVYEIISNHLGMKKVSTRLIPNLLTSIQHTSHVDCCQKLLQEREVNPNNYFHRIVTGDEACLYYYDLLSQQAAKFWKKTDEETPTRLHRTKPAEKIIIVIFWDKYSILLTEYLSGRTTISDPYYASIIERLCCTILEKRDGKVVLLLNGNALIHKLKLLLEREWLHRIE